MAAPPLVLDCPDGGVASATIECATSEPTLLHALTLEVDRGWVDLLVGTSSGAGDVSLIAWGAKRLRLYPGSHLLQFRPGATAFYITATRDREGLAALTGVDFLCCSDIYELPAPWEEEDLFSLRSAQSRDVRWFWHRRHEPRALVRHSNNSWGLIYWRSEDGPFLAPGDNKITLTPAAVSGTSVVMEASEALFDAAHVGALFKLVHPGQQASTAVAAQNTFTEAIRVIGVGDERIFTAVIASTTSTVTLQRSVGAPGNWADVATYAVGQHQINDGFDNAIMYYRLGVKTGDYVDATTLSLTYGAGESVGVARVVEVTDADTVEVDILAPFGAAIATGVWAEGAWSAFRGWPAAGDLYDGRLWLGSLLDVWASAPDDFASFAVGGDDEEAIARTVAVGDASPIVWIKGAFRLQVGVDHGAADIDAVRIGEAASFQIRSTSFDEPITPTNMTMRDVSAKIAFVDATRLKVLRLSYDIDTNSFIADDLTRLHGDIAGSAARIVVGGVAHDGPGFVDLAYSAREKPRLWLPRADGQLACLTLAEAEAVVGWSRHVYGRGTLRHAEITAALGADESGWEEERAAAVESVCATPGVLSGETDQDFAHVIVARVLNGRTRRCHERIEKERRRRLSDAWHLECALRYEGAPARYLTGFDHLLGETVYAWTEIGQLGPFVPAPMDEVAPDEGYEDGEIGIDLGEGVEVTSAIVGLAMETRYMSGKLAYGAQAGSAVGEPKKIGQHVNVLFYETALGSVLYGVADANDQGGEDVWFDPDRLQRVSDVLPDQVRMDGAHPLYTGEMQLTIDADNMIDPRIVFVFDGAGPAAILGYVVNMVTNESP
jgi:hypothetical protein